MSRIGKMPVVIPNGVTVSIESGVVRVKGPRGELSHQFRPELGVSVEDGKVVVARHSEAKRERAFHGLTRALIANMVTGVSTGYKRALDIVGVGYKAEKRGDKLILTVGYSHPVEYPEPAGVTITAPSPTTIAIEGADKQKVGQVAAELRAVRPPEPYKGKGIRYQGEHVRRKAGKTGAK
jgi:large subunit ribosomal protein L6